MSDHEPGKEKVSSPEASPDKSHSTPDVNLDIVGQSEFETLKRSVEKLKTRVWVHSILIPTMLTIVVGIGVFKILLDPHPVDTEDARILRTTNWTYLLTLNQNQEAIVDLILIDAQGKIIDSTRHISFTGPQDQFNSTVLDNMRRISAIAPIMEQEPRFQSIEILGQALQDITGATESTYSEALRLLKELMERDDIDHPFRSTVASLIGVIQTLQSFGEYNRYAEEAFEKAISLETESFQLGLSHNGLGIQKIFRAEEVVQEDPKEALSLLRSARQLFHVQHNIDRTQKSFFQKMNNIIYIDCTPLLYMLEEKIEQDLLLQEYHLTTMDDYFEDIEERLDVALQHDLGNPAALGTAAEYWSLRGEYERKIRKNSVDAAQFLDKSKEYFLRAIREGLFASSPKIENVLDRISNDRRRQEMLQQQKNEVEVARAIKDFFYYR